MNTRDFRVTAGEDRTLTLTAKDSDLAVIDLTSATISFRLAKDVGDGALVTKTGTVTDAANGVFTVTLTDSDTDDLDGAYVYRAYITIAGTTTLGVQGRIAVDKGVPA